MMKRYARENTQLMRAIRRMPQETYNALIAAMGRKRAVARPRVAPLGRARRPAIRHQCGERDLRKNGGLAQRARQGCLNPVQSDKTL
jgi:hypothetical protein